MHSLILAVALLAGCTADADGDGWSAKEDCDDTSPDINPGMDEVCDGIDNNCDNLVDTDAVDGQIGYPDLDDDGYGSDAPEIHCALPAGYVTDNTDCDDRDADIHPGAVEICDGADQDCDRDIDEGAGTPWFEDVDGDGFGDPATESPLCDGDGMVANGDDCNDANDAINPGATETCDGVDNDCDGLLDDDDPGADAQTWYADDDGDGYGDEDADLLLCDELPGYVLQAGDCDDNNSAYNPDATEVCGGGDEDCDGLTDGADPSVEGTTSWYPDVDLDTYGDPDAPVEACIQPADTVVDASDCDDSDPAISPVGTEICNGVDDDCDGDVDDADGSLVAVAYTDGDGDGYGDVEIAVATCTAPSGTSLVGGDCDDAEPLVSPGLPEVCADGLDNDCSGDASGCRWTGPMDAWTDAELIVRGDASDGLGFTYGVPSADLGGDGPTDLVLGAPGVPWVGGTAGAAYVAHGPVPSGVMSAGSLDLAITGEVDGDLFGYAFELMDLDDDGRDDLIVGAPGADEASTGGAVYVWYGDGTSWAGVVGAASADLVLTGPGPSAGLGWSLAAAGDLTGDAVPDLAVGAPGNLAAGGLDEAGSVYVVSGGVRRLGVRSIDISSAARIDGVDVAQNLGAGLAGGTDLTGDAVIDLMIGGPGNHWWQGTYTYNGVAHLFAGPISGIMSSSDATLTITSSDITDAAGVFIASIDDLDGDGVGDLIVSASGDTAGGTDSGKAALFWGPLVADTTIDDADATIGGVNSFTYVGEGLSTADFDGDGFSDLAVSSWADGGAIFYGPLADGDWLLTDADLTVTSSSGTAALASFGSTTRFVGDIDGDGWEDLLVAEPTDDAGGSNAGAAYLLSGDPQ